MAKKSIRKKTAERVKHVDEDAARGERRALQRLYGLQRDAQRLTRQIERVSREARVELRQFATTLLEREGYHVLSDEQYRTLREATVQS